MTERERFHRAIRREETDRIPTFELVFFLTMERYGKVHLITAATRSGIR